MGDVTVYVVRAVSMFAPGSQSARLAGSESKMVRVITEADHLAELAAAYQDGLARGFQDGRVETLREARAAVAERFAQAKRNNENRYSYNMLYGEDVFPAIDRLIVAATTGVTDD